MGSPSQARNTRGVIRRIVAVACLALVTALMWSDLVVDWWQSVIAWMLQANESATQSVLDVRPAGDMDAHVIVWGAVAWAMATGLAPKKWRALVFVGMWSVLVESLQPVFTDIRARQALDYLGNLIGVSAVALGFAVVSVVRSRRGQPNSPAR